MDEPLHTPSHWQRARLPALAALNVFALDQFSKWWLLEVFDIAMRAPVKLCAYFSLVMAWNRGVSFSMFARGDAWVPPALIVLALTISAVLARLAWRATWTYERLGYGLIIGGALGNALDRVRFGAVADFFYAHVGEVGWPAFNVADSAICIGVGLLILGPFLFKK